MSLEDTKAGAVAETTADSGAIVAPLEVSEKPKQPVANRLDFERLYDGVGKIKGLRIRPKPGHLIEYVDLTDMDHRKKCRVQLRTAPARGRPRKFSGGEG